jgi:TnpA family transposase
LGGHGGLRLATYSRKNRPYFAFRELGRAIRTDFLLRYLSSASSGA